MAKTSNLSIRIDPVLKERSEQLFSNFGMNVSEAISIFLHQSLIYGGLPFNIRVDTPNAETIAAMEETDRMIKDNTSKRYSSIDELFEELDS